MFIINEQLKIKVYKDHIHIEKGNILNPKYISQAILDSNYDL